MNILVTGASGQLGQALQQVMGELMPTTNVIFTTHKQLDITSADQLNRFIAGNDITHIVNCAAFTAVDRAEEDKAACTAINSDGVKQLALAADNYGAKIIHISTDFVFDGLTHRAYCESDKVNPTSHYGTSKRAGETALLALAPDSIILRTSWLYSPLASNNFPAKILKAARERKELKVVDDQIGSPTNAFDLARAIVTILNTPQWFSGIYHYCNSGVCSRYDFAKVVLDLAGIRDCKVIPISTDGNFETTSPAARPPFSALNTSRIRLTYGVDTPHWIDSLRDGINRFKA